MQRRDLLELFGIALFVPEQLQNAQRQGGAPATPVNPGPPIRSTPPGMREKFAGMYKLVGVGNTVRTGRIYYDRAGRMGAMLHPPDRRPLPAAPATPTVDDYREMVRGLVAYYGTYDIDETTRRVAHHIEAASNPAWIGTDFVRWYEFQPGRLLLRTRPDAAAPLIWERLPEG
jgi:hypothetical protein